MQTKDDFKTLSGIPVKELYQPEDIEDLDYDKDLGYSGQPPFTRGPYQSMYRGRHFTIRRFTGHDSPEATNKLFKDDIAIGQRGLAVATHIPTLIGLNSDDPRAYADVGQAGVPVDSMQDMEVIFNGITLNEVGVWLPNNLPSMLFLAMAEKRGYDLSTLVGTSSMGGYAAPQSLDYPWEVSQDGKTRTALDFIEWCADNVPRWHNTSVSLYGQRDNGITAIQEMGMMFATAIQIVDDLKKRNMDIKKALRRFAFEMATGNDFFEEICKLRACRRMWYKICAERYGMTDPEYCMFKVRSQTLGSTHTAQEPMNNIIRVAYQIMAGALGGAQTLHANGYDEAICLPTEAATLLSIRTGQILQEETGVTNTVDPLGGSYFVERLTSEMEKKAWEYIEDVEKRGGAIECIKSGYFIRQFKEAILEWEEKIKTGEMTVVGLNKYRMDESEVPYKAPVFVPEHNAPEKQIEKLKKLYAERDNDFVKKALKEHEAACRSDVNCMPSAMKAVKAYATVGEIYDVWRDVYGYINQSPMHL